MKTSRVLIPCLTASLMFAAFSYPARAAFTLPADAVSPSNSVSNAGFIVRTAQASTNITVANSGIRALKQINGTLTDAGGNLAVNVAIPGTNSGGAYFVDTVNFDKDASYFAITDTNGTPLGSFAADYFPGIPGTEGQTTQFASESTALVYLDAGPHTLGICVNADRTDVNDDDGCSLYVGANPHDYFATKVADWQRVNALPFSSNQRIENLIDVVAPVSGIYPFRILYWQTGHGANLQFYVLDTNTQERILVNDPYDPRGPRAFRDTSAARYNGPYVGQVSPTPGTAGNSAAAPIEIILSDGSAATVNTNAIQLYLNGVSVIPQTKTKSGTMTTVRFNPDAGRSDPNNAVKLVYADSKGVYYTNSWSFTILTAGGSGTQVAGQWNFNYGDLRATIGNDLQYLDPTFDGPAGSASDKTRFGTTRSFGISDINGQVARVMRVPGGLDPRYGYAMNHGISPNGGGTRVNQYTLIMDVMVATTGPGAASLLRVQPNGANDGDLFWQGNNFGQGGGGYNGKGTFTAGVWHRVIAAYDEAANPPVVTKYVDGIKQDDWTANQGLDAARRALLPVAYLFADGTPTDERREMWVKSVQIRSGKLTDAQCVLLGGADAAGIPVNLPDSSVSGQWDFEFGDLSATVGAPLAYLNPYFDGPTGTNANLTQFGTCSALGVSLVNGVDAKVMQVPGDLSDQLGYAMTHRIAPNGGGTRVNQYTLIMDVMIAGTGPGAASLLRIQPNGANDGDLFWQGNNFGQGGGGYNGKGTFTPLAWHRVVAAYDEAATPPVVTKYVDGIKQDDWTANQGLDATRRALLPVAYLFADGTPTDERREMWVKSVQIRVGKMSDAQIVALGVPDGRGIPVATPATTVSGQWDFESGDLSATVGAPLAYLNTYFDGPTGTNANLTQFGTCSSLGVSLINGVDAKIMQVPGDLSDQLGYAMTHRIAPNGGGTRVNQYTLLMDVMIAGTGPGAASLLRIQPNGANDGDLFWQGNNFGQGGGGYNGTGAFTPLAWHRVVAAYDEAAPVPVVTKFVDGIFQDNWVANQGLDAPRRALLPVAYLFADGTPTDERRELWVKSVQIRAGKMANSEIIALGAPDGAAIPAVAPAQPPSLTMLPVLNGSTILLWPTSVTGYVLESNTDLASPNSWAAVSGVVSNAVEVNAGPGNRFFRLHKQ